MAPNVTSTSLPCHSIRVWHRAEFNMRAAPMTLPRKGAPMGPHSSRGPTG